ncbi:proline-rich protein 18 [Thamnophis elegans]|uniref:proline-rich protein 18 n=1 Tax=Thamnophis elegans TaxID=35005 RepID=UPI001376D29A|nr:proline-rich protein 18 [Thamnophis elegans]
MVEKHWLRSSDKCRFMLANRITLLEIQAVTKTDSVDLKIDKRRGEASLRFSLSLPPEAIRVLQRRSLEKQRPRGRVARFASPDASRCPLAGTSSPEGDLRALLQVSLLNERHRYDDVEYEEDEAAGDPGAFAADEGLVRKCTEWLRGVESAAARDRAGKMDTLPHLSTL